MKMKKHLNTNNLVRGLTARKLNRIAISKSIDTLKETKREIRREEKALSISFIGQAMLGFINEMNSGIYNRQAYIDGRYTSDFTKFVNRSGIHISEEHRKAQIEYNTAFQKLNAIFLTDILDDTNGCRAAIADYGSIKNIPT